MLKRIILIVSLIFVNIYGNIETDSRVDIEYSRAKNIDNFINKLNTIKQYVNSYILLTGDFNVDNMKTFYNLENSRLWNSFDNSSKLNVNIYNNRIVISNLFPSTIDDNSLRYFKNSRDILEGNIIFDENSVIIQYPSYLQSFINSINELKGYGNIEVSSNIPVDTDKLWYKPDGDGNLYIYRYNGISWEKLGIIDIIKDSSNKLNRNIIVDSYEELSTIPGVDGVYGAVRKDEQYGTQYVFDGQLKKWIALSKGGETGIISVELPNIDPLLNRDSDLQYFKVGSGSKAIVNYILGNSKVPFTRYLKYWLSDSVILRKIDSTSGTVIGKIIIAEKLSDLPVNGYIPIGSIGYLLENNSIGYRGDSNNGEVWFDGISWKNIVPDIDTLVSQGDKNRKYYVLSQQKEFNHIDISDSLNGYWKSSDIIVTKGSRKDMEYISSNYIYLSKNLCQYSETCPKDNIDEPRSTEDGITSIYRSTNSNNYFYQWFKYKTLNIAVNGLSDEI